MAKAKKRTKLTLRKPATQKDKDQFKENLIALFRAQIKLQNARAKATQCQNEVTHSSLKLLGQAFPSLIQVGDSRYVVDGTASEIVFRRLDTDLTKG